MVELKKYISYVLEFSYNKKTHFALVANVLNDGKVLCYRVVQKQKESNNYIPILNEDGSNTGYQVQYACRFVLPNGRFKKKILKCPSEIIELVEEKFFELPQLSDLKTEFKKLREEMKHQSPAQEKELRHRYNELADLINERQCVFLEEMPKSKITNKYSNFHRVPDKQGIRVLSQGGKVSPK